MCCGSSAVSITLLLENRCITHNTLYCFLICAKELISSCFGSRSIASPVSLLGASDVRRPAGMLPPNALTNRSPDKPLLQISREEKQRGGGGGGSRSASLVLTMSMSHSAPAGRRCRLRSSRCSSCHICTRALSNFAVAQRPACRSVSFLL